MFTFDDPELIQAINDWLKKDIYTPVEKPKTCPVKYVFTDHDRIPGHTGQTVSVVPDGTLFRVVFSDGTSYRTSRSGVDLTCSQEIVHTFPNTGCQRSWCDICGVVGHYDINTGAYR